MSDIEDEGEGGAEQPVPETTAGSSKAPSKRPSVTSKETEGFVTKNQQLFLVEFLVDTVNLNPEGFCEELMEGQTCVTLKFLSFPPMTMCEKDFDPEKEPGVDRIRFNSGKSLMFAFTEKQCEDPPPMMAEVIVNKKCPEGSTVEKVDLGRIKICMVQLFQQVYEVAKFTPDRLPASRSLKDCFMLIGRGKRSTGEIGVYVRLTCLGQNVVTEFQCGPNLKEDPILFKNREGKRVYQFSGAEKKEEPEDEGGIGGGESEARPREGCGCLGPLQQQSPPGAQGDAGRSPPSRRLVPTGGPSKNSGRIVLDLPEKTSRYKGGSNSDPTKMTNKNAECATGQEYFVDSRKTKGGLSISQMKASPDENCFVLKVGDKGQIPDRGKMILEFRTPKQKILPKVLPPYHEDIAVQTDAPKKGKGKGKNKKK